MAEDGMAFELISTVDFWGGMDPEGHREYKVKYKVGTVSDLDGPAAAMQTPGLPAIGSTYAFSANEYDLWAWRQPGMDTEPVAGYSEGDFPYLRYVTLTFSTKPRRQDQERPQNQGQNGAVEDPLNEPQKVSGSFTRDKEQGVNDRRGKPIQYSTFEPIEGAVNEWDADKDQVVVEQNVAQLDYPTYGPMKNTLNDRVIWGFPVRSIKLSGATWRKNWGKNNSSYYTRTFTFEIRTKSGVIARTTGGNYSGGTLTITSFPGRYSVADIGSTITGAGIQAGTTITAVSANGATITLSLVTSGASSAAGVTITSTGGLVGDWDRDVVNCSGKVIGGFWTNDTVPVWESYGGDPTIPSSYETATDRSGNPTRLIINPDDGYPWEQVVSAANPAPTVRLEYYRESNFLLLNIPLNV